MTQTIRLAIAAGALLRSDLHPLNKGEEENFWVCGETADLHKNSSGAEEVHTHPPEDDHNKLSLAFQQPSL